MIYSENFLPTSISGSDLPNEDHGEATVGLPVRSGNPCSNPEADEYDVPITSVGVNFDGLEHTSELG